MKNDKVKFLLCSLFFIVLASITFRCAWGSDVVFSASDLNIGRLAQIKNNLPESFFGYFSSKPIMGGSGAGFRLFSLLLAITPLEIFANTFYGFVLVFGSISLVWFLRLWGRSWLASVFGALVGFWVNSIMLSAGGHAYKMEVLAFSVLALCLIEKAIRSATLRKSIGFAMFAGGAVGIMMIEQQDVALLSGLFVGSYTVFRLVQVHGKSIVRWLSVLIPVGIVALLLSGSTVMKSYEHNIAGAAAVRDGSEGKWNYITQWSMVPSEWPELVALGWSGWKTGDPNGPYWGKLGQSAEWETTKQGFQNFKLTSNYFGVIPFLLGLFGMVMAFRNRKIEEGCVVLFWSIAGLIGFGLAFGKYSLLYKWFYHLPMVGNIRAPIKLLDNFQICLGIVSAYGLDYLLVEGKGNKLSKMLWAFGVTCGGFMLLAGLKLLAFPLAQKTEFSKMGFGSFADVMVQNMSNAWFHAALLALLCSGLVFVVWKGLGQAKWVATLFVVVLAFDSLMLTSHYFEANNIATLKNSNELITYLKENQGNERTFFIDQRGIYNQWLASDGPYHDLNLFNIWQMPRMPVEYKEYLGTVGRNQVRMWQLSAIKYVAAPASVLQQIRQNPELGKQFKPILNYQVPTAQGMRKDVLLEFGGGIPRFSLFQGWESLPLNQHCDKLASLQHDPYSTVLVNATSNLTSKKSKVGFQSLNATVTKKMVTLQVKVEEQAIVRFAQYYQSGWRVFIDGKEADLLKVDYLCMGVHVLPGEHIVEFRCLSNASKFIFFLSVLLVAMSGGLVLVLMPEDM